MKIPVLKENWTWVKAGQRTNPKTDFHCYPPWKAIELRSITEKFTVSKSIEGMVLRYKLGIGSKFTCNIENYFGGLIVEKP